jgi:hypothetical protein
VNVIAMFDQNLGTECCCRQKLWHSYPDQNADELTKKARLQTFLISKEQAIQVFENNCGQT